MRNERSWRTCTATRTSPLSSCSFGAHVSARGVSAVHQHTTGRTPERYAELEKLAEEHNGFLFGEVVRRAPAP